MKIITIMKIIIMIMVMTAKFLTTIMVSNNDNNNDIMITDIKRMTILMIMIFTVLTQGYDMANDKTEQH